MTAPKNALTQKKHHEAVTKVCYVFSVIAVIAGIVVFYLGYANA